jgi:polyribonucleotide nucleotidyltransferase
MAGSPGARADRTIRLELEPPVILHMASKASVRPHGRQTMFDIQREELMWGGRKLVLETGKMARQADGAVVATYGETTVLATVVSMKEPKTSSRSR